MGRYFPEEGDIQIVLSTHRSKGLTVEEIRALFAVVEPILGPALTLNHVAYDQKPQLDSVKTRVESVRKQAEGRIERAPQEAATEPSAIGTYKRLIPMLAHGRIDAMKHGETPRDGYGKDLTKNERGEWVNSIGDTPCPNDGEMVNHRCWSCGWVRKPVYEGPEDVFIEMAAQQAEQDSEDRPYVASNGNRFTAEQARLITEPLRYDPEESD